MAKKDTAPKRWAPVPEKKSESEISGGEHFAARSRDNEFVRLMRALPDPDPILRKMGKSVTALRELLVDSHLESVWSVRCAAASGAEWFMAPGDDSASAVAAAESFAEELKGMDIPRVIEEMMDAIAYGYSPLEVLWEAKDGKWGILNIAGKPPEWFEFTQENRLVLKKGITDTLELPPNRFLLVHHRPSYTNPYGVKAFSKCFWPVTFKKNGFRWWTVFVEKYGGAFLFGKYPLNAGEKTREELLQALVKMASDGVAAVPEGTDITINSVADKKGGSDIHSMYIDKCNAEISKAVLGQTLTTEIGDVGSYAAAAAHNLVREDIAAADRKRISAAFNRLAGVYTLYNFGHDVAPPRFEFVKDEDLQAARAERDVKLYQAGWRPKKEYFIREYGMQEDDFDVQEVPDGGAFPGFSHSLNQRCCALARVWSASSKRSLFRRLALFFASKAEKEIEQDSSLMERFDETLLRAAQDEQDGTVDAFADALGNASTYDEAFDAAALAYTRLTPVRCAALLDELRYAARQIGAQSRGKEGKRGG